MVAASPLLWPAVAATRQAIELWPQPPPQREHLLATVCEFACIKKEGYPNNPHFLSSQDNLFASQN
jgi:hypothetical protein